MSRRQNLTLLVYGPLTLLILLLDRFHPGEDIVNYVKYAAMLSLFLLATLVKKRYPEQKYLNAALLCVVVADFFLVFCDTLPAYREQVLPLGITCFTMAYLILILVCQKRFRLGLGELLTALLILALYLPYYYYLWPYVHHLKFYGLSFFGVVLSYMSWTAICTLFRGYYSKKVSWLFALAGLLIFLSDLGVGLAITHPAYLTGFKPWLENVIWAFYIPAWTLIVLVIMESKLYLNHK